LSARLSSPGRWRRWRLAGYTTITGEQLVDHAARGAPLPAKPVLLTFDDATAGQFTHAFPCCAGTASPPPSS
jgi:hypothetical protein